MSGSEWRIFLLENQLKIELPDDGLGQEGQIVYSVSEMYLLLWAAHGFVQLIFLFSSFSIYTSPLLF